MVTYELKRKLQPSVKSNPDGSMDISQGFLVGATTCLESYGMWAGANLEIHIDGAYAKTGLEIETEVNVAVNNYIAQNFPPTA